jgi:hypothetical protein
MTLLLVLSTWKDCGLSITRQLREAIQEAVELPGLSQSLPLLTSSQVNLLRVTKMSFVDLSQNRLLQFGHDLGLRSLLGFHA